jgi:hypothetical protein
MVSKLPKRLILRITADIQRGETVRRAIDLRNTESDSKVGFSELVYVNERDVRTENRKMRLMGLE